MIKSIISTLALVALIGCATIVAPGPDRVPVNTSPADARVLLNGTPMGKTPMVLTLDRKADFEVRIEMVGYEPVVISRSKDLNGWVFGNILLGGLIGLVVDVAAGNTQKHSTDPVYAELKAIKSDGSTLGQSAKVPMTRIPASTK